MGIIISDVCDLFLKHYQILIRDNSYLFILKKLLKNDSSDIILTILDCIHHLLETPEVDVICAEYFSRPEIINIFPCYVNHKKRDVTRKVFQLIIRLKGFVICI